MTSQDSPDLLAVEHAGPVRILRLNRPEHLNAVNENLHDALVAVWSQIEADPDARAVVLTGTGRAFSAGGDLDWLEQTTSDPLRARANAMSALELVTTLLDFSLPVVAAVNGPAVGLGCSLAVLADLVVMAEDAYLADPHVAVGLVAGDGGVFWSSLTGMHVAKEFVLLGDRLDAERAHAIGMANRVVPTERVVPEAVELAHRLAELPPQAVRETKRAFNQVMRVGTGAAAANAALAERDSMLSVEHAARVAALRSRA